MAVKVSSTQVWAEPATRPLWPAATVLSSRTITFLPAGPHVHVDSSYIHCTPWPNSDNTPAIAWTAHCRGEAYLWGLVCIIVLQNISMPNSPWGHPNGYTHVSQYGQRSCLLGMQDSALQHNWEWPPPVWLGCRQCPVMSTINVTTSSHVWLRCSHTSLHIFFWPSIDAYWCCPA